MYSSRQNSSMFNMECTHRDDSHSPRTKNQYDSCIASDVSAMNWAMAARAISLGVMESVMVDNVPCESQEDWNVNEALEWLQI